MRIEKVVLNSSPLIVLFKSEQADILPQLFKTIIVPEQVCFVFQKREKNLRFFEVTYSPPIPV